MSDGSGKPSKPEALTLEAWSQGMMVGSLVVMALITTANMRAGVLLHKLVLLEVRPSLAHRLVLIDLAYS